MQINYNFADYVGYTMKRAIIFLTVFSFSLPAFTSLKGQEAWTLEKCIRYAAENNLQIKQQSLMVQQAENNVLQSKLDFVPSVSGSVSHNMSWGRSVNLQDLEIIENKLSQSTSANLSASMNLLEGLSKFNTLKSNKTQLEIYNYEVEKLKNDISINITQAYLQVLLAQQMEKTAAESYKSVEEQVERTRKLVDAGSQAYSTLLEIQSQLGTEKVQWVTAQNDVRSNLLTLKQLLDLSPDTPFDIYAPDTENFSMELQTENLNSIYNSALDLPQIKSAELALEKSRLDLKIQKGQAYPVVSLSAGYGSYYSNSQEKAFFSQFNDNRNPSLGFSLRIPVFNNWRTNTSIRNARLNVKNYELDLEIKHQNLFKEIQQAYNDALSAYEKYKAAEQNMASSQESFSYVEKKFDLGMLNGTDYTVSRTNLFKAQSEFYQAKYQYIFQLKILDFYKGIPLTL